MFGSHWWHNMGRVSRCGLVKRSVPLQVAFESLKSHFEFSLSALCLWFKIRAFSFLLLCLHSTITGSNLSAQVNRLLSCVSYVFYPSNEGKKKITQKLVPGSGFLLWQTLELWTRKVVKCCKSLMGHHSRSSADSGAKSYTDCGGPAQEVF